MEIGDTIKIRNLAGLLTVFLDKKLSMKDVQRGYGEDKLGSFESCRWEFHRTKLGNTICTLYDNTEEDNYNIFVAFISDYEDIEIWKAHFSEPEKDEKIFETIE